VARGHGVSKVIERLLAAERALAAGQLDVADRLFAQVAEADERNAMAVAGLAEVALARGDGAAARELAQRALAIDPEEAAAARVIATLAQPAAEPTPAGSIQAATQAPAATPGPAAARAPTVRGGSGPLAWLRRLLRRP
jgi:thioredoxin-like negative regulator of GroEL